MTASAVVTTVALTERVSVKLGWHAHIGDATTSLLPAQLFDAVDKLLNNAALRTTRYATDTYRIATELAKLGVMYYDPAVETTISVCSLEVSPHSAGLYDPGLGGSSYGEQWEVALEVASQGWRIVATCDRPVACSSRKEG